MLAFSCKRHALSLLMMLPAVENTLSLATEVAGIDCQHRLGKIANM